MRMPRTCSAVLAERLSPGPAPSPGGIPAGGHESLLTGPESTNELGRVSRADQERQALKHQANARLKDRDGCTFPRNTLADAAPDVSAFQRLANVSETRERRVCYPIAARCPEQRRSRWRGLTHLEQFCVG